MKTSKLIFLMNGCLLSSFIFLFVACNKDDAPATDTTRIADMKVSPAFKFATAGNTSISISTLDNTGGAVKGIRLNIYNDIPENGGTLIMSGVTGEDGIFTSVLKVPADLDSIAIGTTALGFVNMQKVKISSTGVHVVLGGKPVTQNLKHSSEAFMSAANPSFKLLGTYNSEGVPNYLATPNDVVDASVIADINATLPEYQPLPNSHPQYFASTNEPNIVLTDASNVWVTFVSEGAGYRNSLGFYKYNVNNPPATANDIDSIYIIFPNISFSGSGGGLAAGNRVNIGTFPPGTALGWVVVANGFNGTTVTNGIGLYYSNKNLNPEANSDLKKHSVLCNDLGRGKFLLSFEDLRRDTQADNDFNDAVFYVTADPVQSVDASHIPLPDYTSVDSDHDGISDNFDDYPNDATKAFNNYYPSDNSVGTLAFEDLWPSTGDYDFNDMVVDYNFNQITNSQNKVVQIKAAFILKAFGAIYNNGLGMQLPVSPNLIASVTGTHLTGSVVTLNSNGTEAGQSKANIIVFDNAFMEMPYPGGSAVGVNTTPGAPFVQPKTYEVTINLTTPVSLATMGTPPYNPYMIVDGSRGHEVHLIDNPPTDLADRSLLGTNNDDSNPATGRYYVSQQNLPFAIDIAGPFDYPVEKAEVTQAFLKFFEWGTSGGTIYYDWFRPVNGYRDTEKVYSH